MDLDVLLKQLEKGFAYKMRYEKIKEFMDENFLRISNRHDKNFDEEYNIMDIMMGQEVAEIEKKLLFGESIVVEVVDYYGEKIGTAIILNRFKGAMMMGAEIYVL